METHEFSFVSLSFPQHLKEYGFKGLHLSHCYEHLLKWYVVNTYHSLVSQLEGHLLLQRNQTITTHLHVLGHLIQHIQNNKDGNVNFSPVKNIPCFQLHSNIFIEHNISPSLILKPTIHQHRSIRLTGIWKGWGVIQLYHSLKQNHNPSSKESGEIVGYIKQVYCL